MPRTDTAQQVIHAPQDAVFGALVDVHARTHWLPPTGMTAHFEEFDARPGGGYRLVLTYDDERVTGKSGANEDRVHVRFMAIEPPSLVIEESDFVSEDPAY